MTSARLWTIDQTAAHLGVPVKALERAKIDAEREGDTPSNPDEVA